MFWEKIPSKWFGRAHKHFPFLEQMGRHEEFPSINPFFPRTHFLPFFGERIFFLDFPQNAVECKLANILHLAFSEKTPYLLWHTCLQGSCHCHRIFTAISDAIEPLAHVLCCTTVMVCQWERQRQSLHISHRGTPRCWLGPVRPESKKNERTQNLRTWWEGQAYLGNAML